MLQFFNTLTRRLEKFVPIDEKNVRLYVCGPTVYDRAHIGNARAIVVFDLLYRLLCESYGKNHVCYVRNITDVDDKINARALQEYPQLPLNEGIAKITSKTAKHFADDMAALNCLSPNFQPKATEYILPNKKIKWDMVSMINALLSNNHAYVAKGEKGVEILFRTSSMQNPPYGVLSNRALDEQKSGARIAVEQHKESPHDFILWKQSASHEPGWHGNFNGEEIFGRPGWHIECSAMSSSLLGEVFDIHGGGHDLIFPHHENEIAQSCCVHGKNKMANFWLHNGMLQIEGKKMSKSLGNFFTVADLVADKKMGGRIWSGDVVRLCLLLTSYREPLDFTCEKLQQCDSLIKKWKRQVGESPPKKVPKEMLAILGNDLDISAYLAKLGELSPGELRASLELLGLTLAQKNLGFDPLPEINRRLEFLAQQNWGEADAIRATLLKKGIVLKDSKDENGNRTTTWETL